jgi:hypothetical protein
VKPHTDELGEVAVVPNISGPLLNNTAKPQIRCHFCWRQAPLRHRCFLEHARETLVRKEDVCFTSSVEWDDVRLGEGGDEASGLRGLD